MTTPFHALVLGCLVSTILTPTAAAGDHQVPPVPVDSIAESCFCVDLSNALAITIE